MPNGVQVLMGDRDFDVSARNMLNTCDRAIRPDAVLAVEVVLTASPEWFSTDGTAGGPRDLAKTAAWTEASLGWVRREIGEERVAAAILHNDEATPHLHIFFVPLDTKTRKTGRGGKAERTETGVNAGRWLDGRERLSGHQTTYGEALEPLGIERGRVKAETIATHEDTKQWRQRAESATGEMEAAASARTQAAAIAAAEAQAARVLREQAERDLVQAKTDREIAAALRAAADEQRLAATQDRALAVSTLASAEQKHVRANALMVGVEAVADGKIVAAKEEGGKRLLTFDSPQTEARLRPAIKPAEPQVWGFARKVFEATQEKQEKLLEGARRILAETTRRAVLFEQQFRGWWQGLDAQEKARASKVKIDASRTIMATKQPISEHKQETFHARPVPREDRVL